MGTSILPYVAGGTVGMVCAACLGSYPLAAVDSNRCEEARYRGHPTSYWIAQLEDRDQSFREQALQALEQLGTNDENVVPALAGMLADPNPRSRIGAAFALRRLGPMAKAAIPRLIGALQDRDYLVRINAAVALVSTSPRDPTVIAAITPLLNDERVVVRQAVLRILKDVGSPAELGQLGALGSSR